MTQLYVGNLSAEGDEKAIRALFGKYGQVREVLMKNGYAFVEFESPIAAEDAMRELNGEWCSIRTYVFSGAQCTASVGVPFNTAVYQLVFPCIMMLEACSIIMYDNKTLHVENESAIIG